LFFGYLTEPFIITLVLYLVATVLTAFSMIAAGIAEWFIGVEAAGRSLEDVPAP
jgi:hypothetical protein